MESLLGHGEVNEISPILCALERDHVERKTCDAGCEMQLFVQRSGEETRGSGVAGLGTDGIARKQGVCIVQMRVSQINSSLARSLLRGFCDALRHGAVLLSGLLSQSKSRPLLQNARLGAWESRPLAQLRKV